MIRYNSSEYKLKYGVYLFIKYLDENLLKGSFGFIQNIFTLFQSFNDSDTFFIKHKELANYSLPIDLLDLAAKKNPIASPFIQMLIVSFIMKFGFSDSLLTEKMAVFSSDK